jgi:nucleoid-associated protein YgaU
MSIDEENKKKVTGSLNPKEPPKTPAQQMKTSSSGQMPDGGSEFVDQRKVEHESAVSMRGVIKADVPKFIAEHTVAEGEMLSHLALKYYGHATPPYWKHIYEANKGVIGDNPSRVEIGMVIKIPELPPDFKG